MKRGVFLLLFALFLIVLNSKVEAVLTIQSAISPIYVGETDTLLAGGGTDPYIADSYNWEILTPSVCKFSGTDIYTNNQIRSYPKGLSAGTCSIKITRVANTPLETTTYSLQVLAAAAPSPASLTSCSVKASCSSGEIALASLFDTKDSHISSNINKFPYKLCCAGTSLSRSCVPIPPQKADAAHIYVTDDSHIDPQGQPNSICLSVRDQSSVSCRYSNTGCNTGEVCLLSFYQSSDSHVADCNALSTQTKICCTLTQAKTCYNQGEAKADSDPLQCCATSSTGQELYYSKEVDSDVAGGCCVKVDEGWNSFTGGCEPSGAIQCSSNCQYSPTSSNYWSTNGCFLDLPTPLPYEFSCCEVTQFGATDKFQIPIEVVRDANNKCTGAKFCSSTTKSCSSTPDSFCPENYGDWSTCPLNEVGNKCSICDPDCGTCGSISFSQFKDPASQNEQLTIKVEYNVPVVKAISLWRVISGTDYYISTANCQVQGSVCTVTFSPSSVSPGVVQYLTTPSSPGSPYTFKSYLSVAPDIIITKTGYTLPKVEIQFPSSGSTLSGLANIQVKAQSDSSISKIKWYIEKRSSGVNQAPLYSPVNIVNNLGSCTFCNSLNCNLLGSAYYAPAPPNTNAVATKEFDTLKCDNNDFMLKVIAEDLRGNKAEASIPVSTNNVNAPCTDSCPVYDSTILKIVIAKFKTWI